MMSAIKLCAFVKIEEVLETEIYQQPEELKTGCGAFNDPK